MVCVSTTLARPLCSSLRVYEKVKGGVPLNLTLKTAGLSPSRRLSVPSWMRARGSGWIVRWRLETVRLHWS